MDSLWILENSPQKQDSLILKCLFFILKKREKKSLPPPPKGKTKNNKKKSSRVKVLSSFEGPSFSLENISL
jgi:hypothetical protein